VPRETPDGFGGVLRAYAPGPALWGAIEALGSRRAGAPGEATHRVTLPWRGDVDARMRLALGPRRFRIHGTVDPDGRGRDLVCLVEEIAP
jgi:head-tail adaptor